MSHDKSISKQQASEFDLAGVLAREVMAHLIHRERARVDRSGGCLTLVVFDLGADAVLATLFAWAALRRKRLTDDVGWYGEDSVALLLPGTDPNGAQIVVKSICQLVRVPVSYSIYRYPNEQIDPGKGRLSLREGGTHCRGVFDLPTLLEPRVPSWKRAIDVSGSVSGLLLTSPLFLAAALYIKAVSPGPVFYRQERVGRGGRRFQLLKFRTMKPKADEGVHQQHLTGLLRSDVPMMKLDNSRDSRIIPLGNLLRWSGLDELPQLINVLRGEMSIVGPRPCLPYEAEQYQLWQTRRFDQLPGITGLWQVSGKNRLTFKQMVRLDIRYGLYPSLRQDLRIMLRTLPTMISMVIESLASNAESRVSRRAPDTRSGKTVPRTPPGLLQQP